MNNTDWHPTNYRKNLIQYWRQFCPGWNIPKGFHVHHIKPKSLNKSNPRIHYPQNLIALHPDDHAAIHRLRGDTITKSNFIKLGGRPFGHIQTEETKQKIAQSRIGVKRAPFTNEHKAKLSAATKGRKKGPMSKKHKAAIAAAQKARWDNKKNTENT